MKGPAKKLRYVVGFMFTQDLRDVVLIRKEHPPWQKGLFNGLGGKMKPGETPESAMVREFEEEGGLVTNAIQWHWYHNIEGDVWFVHCLCAFGEIQFVKTVTDEEISFWNTKDIHPLETRLVDAVSWLIPMAVERLKRVRRGVSVPAPLMPL